MNQNVRETREHVAQAFAERMRLRFAAERRLQLAALAALAFLVLLGTLLYTGVHNVFLPGWWRLG